jgi:predicted MFS family arabinose efflux permease
MLAAAAFSSSAWLFLAASLGIGLGSVAAQVLVPFAAHLSREATRGQTVGKVVSGLLLGIMLARPAASLIADHFSWHAVFGGAAVRCSAARLRAARAPAAARAGSPAVRPPDRFDVAAVGDDPGAAPPRRLPCRPCSPRSACSGPSRR